MNTCTNPWRGHFSVFEHGFLELLLWQTAEREDVAILSCGQDKCVVKAEADVAHVAVVVVMDAEGPVHLHGAELMVRGLYGVRPNTTILHAT